jgi:integrase
MASMTKKGKSGYWFARFYNSSRSPKEKTVPLKTTRKPKARERLAELEQEYERGAFDPWSDAKDRHLSAADAVERFLEQKAQDVRESTVQTYRQQLEAWLGSFSESIEARAIEPKHLRPYVTTYTAGGDGVPSRATQRKRYRHLRAFINWLLDEGLITGNPLDEVTQPKKQEKKPAFLSPSELEELLDTILDHAASVTNIHGEPSDVKWLWDLIQVAVCTGLRRSDLVNLRWRDIDLEQRFLTTRNQEGHTTKSGHEHRVPLRSSALEVLRRRHEEAESEAEAPSGPVFTDRSGAPIKPDRVTKRFKFFVRKADLKDKEELHFHSLRHTCGAWLASSGIPLRVIQEILGHSSASVTEIYSHLQPDVMGDAMEEAFGDL